MKKSSRNPSLNLNGKNVLNFPGHPSERIRAGVRAALAKISYRTQSVLSRSFDFSAQVLPDKRALTPMNGEPVESPSDDEIDSALRALRGHGDCSKEDS